MTALVITIPGRPPTPNATDLWPWDDPTAVIPIELHGEPVSKARARIRMLGGKVSSYTPSGTVLAQNAVAAVVREVGFAPTDAFDFAVSLSFRLGSWQRRDIDNLAKLVLDAMTGIVWVDDVQVRRLSLELERGSDDPGTSIRVWTLPKQRAPTSPCGWCEKPLRTYDSWAGSIRFCDKDCRMAASASARVRRCDVCLTEYLPLPRRPRVTCSTECFLALQQRVAGAPVRPTGGATIDARRRVDRERKLRQRLARQPSAGQVSSGLFDG